MKIKIQTSTRIDKEKNRIGIYLEKRHYDYLQFLANSKFQKNQSHLILYLMNKYLYYLYQISNTNAKKTFTVEYQPKTKFYKRYGIFIEPILWGKLTQLRFKTGYSISFLLRIMLEWEMSESFARFEPYIAKPRIPNTFKRKLRFIQNNDLILHNYVNRWEMNFQTKWVYNYFFDEFL